MSLTRLEQETIIIFNAAEGTAEIETYDPIYIRKLDKLCVELPDTYKKDRMRVPENQEGGYYIVPKKLIRFGKPITREMTEEQRVAARERLARARVERETKRNVAEIC